MPTLPVNPNPRSPGEHEDSNGGGCGSGGCGTSCGAGLEKIYPSTAIRYGAMNWVGEFEYRPNTVFKCGAKVVIQTDRGIELGEQVSLSCSGCTKSVSRDQLKAYVKNSGPEFYRLHSGRIHREATPQDIAEADRLNANRMEDLNHCQRLAREAGLDMKFVTVEHLLGGERIVFYFRSEERVDFRGLVRELAQHHQTRIELRQVGARDEARLVADYEICGRECCCKNFLKKLRPVTMKMAKLQKSTLDPTKVSGRCGRLRCCLRYEHEGYEELTRKLPRVGSRVSTANGPATVLDRQILTQLVMVRMDDGAEVVIPNEELAPPGEPAPKPAPRPERREDDAENGVADNGETSETRRRRRRDGRPRRSDESAEKPEAQSPPRERDKTPPPSAKSTDESKSESGSRDRRRRRRRRRGRRDRPDSPPTDRNNDSP